ncbi:hypothetical protein GF1_28690 [Desulfolithobacter dissulfuricans]|uniref:Uncharacterized protein n=1 Tax=Desulfolithobacter dissulfuricans TaxID=2795293 RepID=A0A915U3A8_9BACT|nr:hypothetical protein GF1_28690 [Desulfolithobacter dissulfuricans]
MKADAAVAQKVMTSVVSRYALVWFFMFFACQFLKTGTSGENTPGIPLGSIPSLVSSYIPGFVQETNLFRLPLPMFILKIILPQAKTYFCHASKFVIRYRV